MAIRDRLEGVTTRVSEGARGAASRARGGARSAASSAASAYAETARDAGRVARREAGRGKRAAVKRARQELEAAGGHPGEDEQDAMFRRAEEVATAGPAVDATLEPVSNLASMDKLVTGGFDEATGRGGQGPIVAYSDRVGAWAVVSGSGDVVDSFGSRRAAIDRAASFATRQGGGSVRVLDRQGDVDEVVDVDGGAGGGGFDVGVGLAIGGGPGGAPADDRDDVEADPFGVGIGFGLEEDGDQEADPLGVGFGGFGLEDDRDDVEDDRDPFGVGFGFGGED